MLAQYALHFLDRFGMPLCRVTGADKFFRFHAVDMSALVRAAAVGFSSDRAVA